MDVLMISVFIKGVAKYTKNFSVPSISDGNLLKILPYALMQVLKILILPNMDMDLL